MTVSPACFVVHGSGLTDLARNMVLSDSPAKAWRTLTSGLRGEGVEKVTIEILEGRSRLTGDSLKGIGVAAERKKVSTSYQKNLDYIFAGRVKIRGAWYRPVAQIHAFSPEDTKEACRELPEDPNFEEALAAIRTWWKRRAAAYANEGEIVVEIPGEKPTPYFLFEPVSEGLFWRPELSSPKEAVDQCRTAGRKIREISPQTEEDETSPLPTLNDEEEATKLRLAQEKREDEENERWEKERKDRLQTYSEQVRKQAGEDFFELRTESGKTYRIPRPPFVRWALSRTSLRHLMPAWENVSPSGLKLPLDNPDHTDWMLGAGLDLEETYSFGSEVMKAALDESFRIQSDLGDFTYTVLSGGPEVEGVIGEDILVLSDLRNTPENNAALASARGILTERGGELAHVAVVAREMRVPLFLVPNALKAFRAGERVKLCAEEGKIFVLGWGGNP